MKTNMQINNISFQSFKPIKVDNRLYRGKAILSPNKFAQLEELGVTQIIDLRNSAKIKGKIEKIICELFGMKYINFKYPYRLNHLPQKEFFEQINNAIVKNEGKTYIHCQYGKRRTGIAVAIYEKENTNKTPKEIIQNMLMYGFKELTEKTSQKINIKRKKLEKIFNDFISKYYPNYKAE